MRWLNRKQTTDPWSRPVQTQQSTLLRLSASIKPTSDRRARTTHTHRCESGRVVRRQTLRFDQKDAGSNKKESTLDLKNPGGRLAMCVWLDLPAMGTNFFSIYEIGDFKSLIQKPRLQTVLLWTTLPADHLKSSLKKLIILINDVCVRANYHPTSNEWIQDQFEKVFSRLLRKKASCTWSSIFIQTRRCTRY